MAKDEKDDLIQSHGMTVAEHKRIAMIQGGTLNENFVMLKPNRLEHLKDRHFLDEKVIVGHTFPEHEASLYHLAQETRSFNAVTGEKFSKAFVQKYDKQTYNFMLNNRGFEGQTVYILHDPTLTATPVEPEAPSEELLKLREVASEAEIPFSETTTVAELKDAIAAFAVKSMSLMKADREERNKKLQESKDIGNAPGNAPGPPQQSTEVPASKPVKTVGEVIDESWTVAQLRDLADSHGIALLASDTKPLIMDKIKGSGKPLTQ